MGFINIGMESNIAFVWNENAEENGWVFEYDAQDKVFLVWENSEYHAIEKKHTHTCDNLEQVYRLVSSFT